MAFPKFEESFNPNKHYDPDRERTEAAKLKKEFKRERKGAIRELRRDAKVRTIFLSCCATCCCCLRHFLFQKY